VIRQIGRHAALDRGQPREAALTRLLK
jgi:hypothetical protein